MDSRIFNLSPFGKITVNSNITSKLVVALFGAISNIEEFEQAKTMIQAYEDFTNHTA